MHFVFVYSRAHRAQALLIGPIMLTLLTSWRMLPNRVTWTAQDWSVLTVDKLNEKVTSACCITVNAVHEAWRESLLAWTQSLFLLYCNAIKGEEHFQPQFPRTVKHSRLVKGKMPRRSMWSAGPAQSSRHWDTHTYTQTEQQSIMALEYKKKIISQYYCFYCIK